MKSVLGSAPLTLVDVLNLVERPIPIIAAPMAGGGSTPALAAAVSGAGGLGFLAAGYRDAEQVAQAVRQTRELTDQPFGVNVFVPDSANVAASALRSSQPSSQDEAADRAALVKLLLHSAFQAGIQKIRRFGPLYPLQAFQHRIYPGVVI